MGKELLTYKHKRYDEMLASGIEKIRSHPEIQKLIKKYPEHSHDLTSPSRFKDVEQYISCIENCLKCPGLESCRNNQVGHYLVAEPNPVPYKGQQQLYFKSRPCKLKKAADRQKILTQRIQSYNVDADNMSATFDDLDDDPQRRPAILKCITFCAEFRAGETDKGLYLFGSYGVGKSRIAGAIANEMAGRGFDVAMVYVPDFFEEIKDAIGTNGVREKVDAIKNVTVLILDDIGAEPLSSWLRDGVLGTILNHRMQNRLLTVYTSNLDMSELRQHIGSVKDEKMFNERKANRIMERIEPFVQVVQVNGRNRRRTP
ncbi:primosomal protein DnaI [Paenibacillus apiarius]|nr:primosomal protein DnaI [Paenibacillus apiarius]MCY9554492.1 primosomal protein DnaI [Paenibacillus apiarius]MEC0118830.1 primosomal protein DnaI [Paenibacillus apiarius]MEC0193128.1 primosomal protein DnaI [Paenibacillus apiarius]